MLPYLTTHFGNPSSSHGVGQRAKQAVTRAREEVAALIGGEADEIVFTSGGTEANNLAIFGLPRGPGRTRIITSCVEHPATAEAATHSGLEVVRLAVDAEGRVELGQIDQRTALVTVIHAQNETGVLQPVEELAARARAAGALSHTDAAQSLGKVEVNVRALGVDALSIAGHKLYGPKGVGALWVRQSVGLRAITFGAGHERGLRPGTENVAGIAGLGAACVAARRDLLAVGARLSLLRDLLFARLSAGVPGLRPNGHPTLRVPGALNVCFPRVSGSALLEKTPEIAASTGSACHAGHETASAVLLQMGIAPNVARGAVRLTLGRSTTEAEVERAAAALIQAWKALA